MTQTVPAKATNFVRAYLRASTKEQDAQRARGSIDAFAQERGLSICNYYAENESGARLDRPELFRLLSDCQSQDILLIEDVDRLSREGANKQVISSQADSLIKISRIWADFFPANTSNQPI